MKRVISERGMVRNRVIVIVMNCVFEQRRLETGLCWIYVKEEKNGSW